MRLFRKITHVCQNCIFGNNEKGKLKKTILRKSCEHHQKRYYWHIFCEKKRKFYPWDWYKRCFEPQEWVIKNDYYKKEVKRKK